MRRSGFTLIELIFVIVIMGILAKFGVEFLAQAYKSFIASSINNTLQAQSGTAVESIASKLQYRIKDSIIARQPGVTYQALASSTLAENATVLEWVGSDIDGFRGNSLPNWSGIIDLDLSDKTTLNSPETNTTAINTLIGILADNNGTNDTSINNAAIYFIGSDSDINNYGWNGVALADHNTSVMHPINSTGNINEFTSGIGVDFSGTDIYEYYQLAWTAYAVVHEDSDGDGAPDRLVLYYDYQPWEGESYLSPGATNQLLMENVSTFRFKAIGSIVKIQVCVNSDVVEDYSLCKEKTVY